MWATFDLLQGRLRRLDKRAPFDAVTETRHSDSSMHYKDVQPLAWKPNRMSCGQCWSGLCHRVNKLDLMEMPDCLKQNASLKRGFASRQCVGHHPIRVKHFSRCVGSSPQKNVCVYCVHRRNCSSKYPSSVFLNFVIFWTAHHQCSCLSRSVSYNRNLIDSLEKLPSWSNSEVGKFGQVSVTGPGKLISDRFSQPMWKSLARVVPVGRTWQHVRKYAITSILTSIFPETNPVAFQQLDSPCDRWVLA